MTNKICSVNNCKYPVYAKKMCNNHYWQDLNKKNAEKNKNKSAKIYKSKVKEKRNKLTGETQKEFLFKVLEYCPNNCQCCGEKIKYKSISNCAHILEKSRESFFMISNNSKNIVYLCDYCHNGFDNKGQYFFNKQNESFKELIKDRVKYLSNFLTEAQKTKIKEYLIK